MYFERRILFEVLRDAEPLAHRRCQLLGIDGVDNAVELLQGKIWPVYGLRGQKGQYRFARECAGIDTCW